MISKILNTKLDQLPVLKESFELFFILICKL